MAITVLKPSVIINTMLGVLKRSLVLPRLVWSDAVIDFTGALNDTVTVRVPAYGGAAETRALRSGGPLTLGSLTETSVAVQLSTDVYKGLPVTDEELTLDISDFGAQVINPIIESVARTIEDELVAAVTGATFDAANQLTLTDADPYLDFVDARERLNLGRVPMQNRVMAVGSQVETKLLKSDRFKPLDNAISTDMLTEATIGRMAGFRVVSVPSLPPDKAYGFHRTAFILGNRAPRVPEGVTWGESRSFEDLALRVIRDYDPINVEDRCIASSYIGTAVVTDNGAYDVTTGQWEPASGSPAVLVRAVEITDAA